MNSEKIDIKKLIPNAENPRIIRDDKFEKLVQSVKDFPEMLEIRPIVVNEKMIILGGNMRYQACIAAGLKKVPVMKVSLTPEQEAEFIIKDNVSGGEWDWDKLANEWDIQKLEDWGTDLKNWATGSDVNSMQEEDLNLGEEFNPVGKSADVQRVVFLFNNKEDAETYLTKNKIKFEKRNMAWQVNMNTQFT